MISNGYVKLYRKLIEWEWYTDQNTKSVFLHCLLKANHKEKKWKGIDIEKGEFVTSLNSLKKELGLSTQQIRTSLKKLELGQEICKKSTNEYTTIIVLKWEDYQGQDDDSNKRVTNEQQTSNKRVTTTKNDKKEKNDKNKEKPYVVFDNTTIEFELSNLLYESIIKNNRKMKKPNMEVWSKQIDLMIRVDKYTPQEIKDVIEFASNDSFWWSNILSTKKLREKFITLSAKMKGGNYNDKPKQDVPDYMTENKKKPDQSEEKRKELLDKLRRKENE